VRAAQPNVSEGTRGPLGVGADGLPESDRPVGPDPAIRARVERDAESEKVNGTLEVGADALAGNDGHAGPDLISVLASLSAAFEDIQRTRKSQVLRAIASEKNGAGDAAVEAQAIAEALLPIEQQLARKLKKYLSKHPLYPWLEQFKGLAGPKTAQLMAVIRDPFLFPGKRCTEGHYVSELWGGDACPAVGRCEDEEAPGLCAAPLQSRRGSGVRSLWHYCGLHAIDGRSPRKRRGQQADWNVKAKTLILMPDGLADQIVRHRTPKYRDIYDETKARVQRERGVVVPIELDAVRGPAPAVVAEEVGTFDESEIPGGRLRPFQIDRIARKVAVKAFVGDLLLEWKRLVRAEACGGSDLVRGSGQTSL
jgi:hypothetical protein